MLPKLISLSKTLPRDGCVLIPLDTQYTRPYELNESIGVMCICISFSFFYRNSCKKTVYTLIRRRIQRRQIWVCTVCLGPKGMGR